MASILRFGVNRQIELHLPGDALVADWTHSAVQPLNDPAAAAVAALRAPLDLPPVAQAIVPGDHIVLALDAETPQAPRIVAGAIQAILESGADPRQVTVVLSHARDEEDVELLPDGLRDVVQVEVHQPDNPDSLCYLATSAENLAIYLNRRIVEAEFVLPIGPLRPASSFGYFGSWGGLFPAFADQATRQRYQSPGATRAAVAGRLRHEADEAAWLLGVQYVLQVAPGPDDRVLAVLAGSAAAVHEHGQRLCEDAWRRPLPQRAGLVIAAISGGPDQQTWENFGRALYAAAQAVDEDGAIALCTQLRRPPGPALQRLSGVDEESDRQRAVARQDSFDAQSASLLAELLEKKRIYLLSELDGETVEDLGLAHVATEAEMARLTRSHDSCILLADAQYAMPESES